MSKLYLTLIATLLTGCGMIFPRVYSSQSIEGWVVDADTKKPLQGVNVVADWILVGGLEGGNVDGHIHVSETVSNIEGHFFLPSWEPLWTGIGFGHRNPRLFFFKSGYQYEEISNTGVFGDIDPSEQSGPLWVSRWNGQTIELKHFEGSLQEYADHLSSLNISIEYIVGVGGRAGNGKNCEWQKIQNLLNAIFQQMKLFEKQGVSTAFFMSISDIPLREECGVPSNFFKESVL